MLNSYDRQSSIAERGECGRVAAPDDHGGRKRDHLCVVACVRWSASNYRMRCSYECPVGVTVPPSARLPRVHCACALLRIL